MKLSNLELLYTLFKDKEDEYVYGVDLDTNTYIDLSLDTNNSRLVEFRLGEFDSWVLSNNIQNPIIIHNHVTQASDFSLDDRLAYNEIKKYINYDIGFYLINLKTGILKNIKEEVWLIKKGF